MRLDARPRLPWLATCCAGGTHEADALHAEWTKLRTVPGTGWLLLAAAVLTGAVSAAAAAASTARRATARRG